MRLRLFRSYAHLWRIHTRVLVGFFATMTALAVLFAVLVAVRYLVP